MAKGQTLYSFDGTYAVRLDLSRDEADTLYAVLWAVGGDRWHSPNKHVTAVYMALEAAGLDRLNVEKARALRSGEFQFANYPTPFREGYYRCKVSKGGKEVKHFTHQPTDFHNWEPVTVTASE
jgi:hypothetical protein